MSRRNVWLSRILILLFVIFGSWQIWRHTQDYIFADQFAAVVPGKIFRGAWQQPWPMRRIVREHHIKTIVALAHPPDHPLCERERELAKELGCQWIHIPIVDNRLSGDVRTVDDCLEKAARILADPKNQPIYFHCHHGINRASMVQIAYRTLYCGWTLDQATDEISRTFGLREVNHGPDYRHMASFYERRVLPLRQARSAATATAARR
jgi:protein tyrosine/serine phosphatase